MRFLTNIFARIAAFVTSRDVQALAESAAAIAAEIPQARRVRGTPWRSSLPNTMRQADIVNRRRRTGRFYKRLEKVQRREARA